MSESSDWRESVEEWREKKDQFFIESPDSPIREEDKSDFDGLAYFSINSDYRFELEVKEHDEKDRLEIEVSGDGDREYIRWGEFHFEVEGEEQVLQAYKGDLEEEGFFVPFRDATSGGETYGAGRYIDLNEDDYLGDDKWLLDFNKAYNPYCAYSEKYSCPLAPPENWLDIPIKAGEKKYPLKDK